MSKDPLVFSEEIKSVLYTHSLKCIKINQQINLDFFPSVLNYLSSQVLTFLDECCFELTFYFWCDISQLGSSMCFSIYLCSNSCSCGLSELSLS